MSKSMFGREVRASEAHSTIGPALVPFETTYLLQAADWKKNNNVQCNMFVVITRDILPEKSCARLLLVSNVYHKPYPQISCRRICSRVTNIIQVHAQSELSGDTRRHICVPRSQLFITPFLCIKTCTHLHLYAKNVNSSHDTALSKELQYTFVGTEHNSGTGYHTEHVRNQTAVERRHAFFFPYQSETLNEASILLSAVFHGRLP